MAAILSLASVGAGDEEGSRGLLGGAKFSVGGTEEPGPQEGAGVKQGIVEAWGGGGGAGREGPQGRGLETWLCRHGS